MASIRGRRTYIETGTCRETEGIVRETTHVAVDDRPATVLRRPRQHGAQGGDTLVAGVACRSKEL